MKKAEKDFSLRTTYIVYASPDKVFEALTDSGIVAAWGGGIGLVEPKAGGKFEFFDGWIKGEVLIYKPGKELSYTWKPSEWEKKIPASVVNYKFRPHKAGTEVILTHTELPSQEEADKHKEGWIDYVFDPINDFFTS
jgi:uncharacterized protein YndB with AHSA1/START domain